MLSIAVVFCDTNNELKWQRYLLSEKVPKQVSLMNLRLFLRTKNWSLIPPKYSSDQKILSLLGVYRNRIENEHLKLINMIKFKKAVRTNRKRGYTDGVGNLNLTTDELLYVKEEQKDFTARELHHQIEVTRNLIQEAEDLLVDLLGTTPQECF
jgi:hypothetical protein